MKEETARYKVGIAGQGKMGSEDGMDERGPMDG